MDQQPAGPPRKRRRPALSCFECRRRKIKCDRDTPCGQCTQSRFSTCTYGPDAFRSGGARKKGAEPSSASSAVSIASPARRDLPDAVTSDTVLIQYHSPASEPHQRAAPATLDLVNHFPTPGSSPNTIGIAEAPSWICRPSPSDPQPGGQASGQTVEALQARIYRLEQLLTATVGKISAAPSKAENAGSLPSVTSTDQSRQHVRGTLSKTRLFGQSHWLSSFEQFDKIRAFANNADLNDTSTFRECDHNLINSLKPDIQAILMKCKNMAREAKAQRPINLYLRTFESAYRILHIPSFQSEYAEYWKSPQDANSGFIVKLLLVMAIGSRLYRDIDDPAHFHSWALEWIYAGQSWLSAPLEKSRLNLTGLQVHCLLLLARQICSMGAELVWISAGALLRMAIQMGLHRDPKHFPKISAFHAEIRRRLWVTILEMTTQFSLDSGMPPLISLDDFDTEPPANIDDHEIEETTKQSPPSRPSTTFTETTLQIFLLKSLHTRMEVTRLINSFKFQPQYEKVLQLGNEINTYCREIAVLMQRSQTPTSARKTIPTVFHRNLLDQLLRRFMIALHRPFAIKARTDPRFYFSRKVCLESALAVMSPEPDDDFAQLLVVGGGPFREVTTHAGITLTLEHIMQLEEDGSDATLQRNKAGREPLRNRETFLIDLLEKRIRFGECNVKGPMFMSMVLGQIEAMENGTSVEQGISDAAKRSSMVCYEILKARMGASPAVLQPEFSERQQDDVVAGNTEAQDLGFDFLENSNLNFELPDSWLFPGWEEISWS